MIKLFEHQKIGKEYLLKMKKACLFYEIGTGKTFTALAAIQELPEKCKILIVAPKNVLLHVWLTQTEYDLSRWDVQYINYEKIARDKSIITKKYDCIILDEVHKVKGKSTNTSKRINILSKKATYVWGLTGTPVANNYADVYNIYKNMDITEFDMSYNEFCTTYYYCRPLEKGIYTIPILIAPKTFKLDELLERISYHSITKRLIDCVELPDKQINIHHIKNMDSKQYKEIESGIFRIKDEERTMIKLETINKAHQAANGFVYSKGLSVRFKDNLKLQTLRELSEMYLEELDKLIVVYYYEDDKYQIYTKLFDLGVTFNISDFTNTEDKKILLLQFGQAEGLNLQFCNRMIFYTYDYSFLKFEQMCGRIYRTGQKNKVIYDILINSNTIEEKIWKAISKKQSTDEFLKEVLKKYGDA